MGSLLGSLIVVVFGQHYLQALSMGLAGYFVAQSASDLSMFLTGYRTGVLRVQKHVVKVTIYTTRQSSSSNSSSSRKKKFSLTLPWVVLFSDSGLYQSPESLRTRRRTCAVPRRALFCSSTSLIDPGIWASQPGNLSALAPSAPTTTGITMILTFHSCSSSIFND